MKASFFPLVLFIALAAANASIVVGPWVPIFKGVDHAKGRMIPDAVDPRLQAVNALRIDLTDPDVHLFTDPPCTNCPSGTDTIGLTTSGFLNAYGLQAAVNANFFGGNGGFDVTGLSISQGRVVSAQEGPTCSTALLFATNNQATIINTNWIFATNGPGRPATNNAGIYTAVSGSYPLVIGGVNIGCNYTNLTDPIHLFNPRTAAGVSRDGRYLYLVTIDGREPGYSDGAIDPETADWLIRFGSYDGLNLDGGASTTMVMADCCCGGPIELNLPSYVFGGGQERVVGNHLGVFAKPLFEFISDLAAVPLDTIATITWRTASNATSQVEYGLTTNHGSFSAFDPTPVTDHLVMLNGLGPGSSYFFRAISSIGATQYTAGCGY